MNGRHGPMDVSSETHQLRFTPSDGRPPVPTKTSVCDSRRSDLPEGMAGNWPMMRERRSMDVGTRATGGGNRTSGLPSAGAGNREVDCDAGWEADGGPVALRVIGGDTKQGVGINDGNSRSNDRNSRRTKRGGARDTEPDRTATVGGASPTPVTNVGGDGGARLMVAEG